MLRPAHLSRVALLAAVSAGGCAAIIGLPDYGPGTGGAGGSGTSSASGTGGAASSASSASAGTATTASSSGSSNNTGSSGSTGSAGTGGTGGSSGCQDGAACYLGLDGTEGVGPCAAGTLSCEGGVPHCSDTRPALQSCSQATTDGNCDGVQGCTGQSRWSNSGTLAVARSVAASVDGSVAVVGTLDTAIAAGNGLVDAFDAKGRKCWGTATTFGGGGAVLPTGVALSGSKKTPDQKPTQVICSGGMEMAATTIVVGQASGPVNFGAGVLANAGGQDAFIAAFGPTGAISWGKVFGSASDDAAAAVAVGSQGEIYVTGYFEGAVTVPGCAAATGGASGMPAAYVAKLAPDGTCQWIHTYPGASGSSAAGTGIAVSPDGSALFAVGRFFGTVDLADGGTIGDGGANDNTFIFRLDPPTGNLTASRTLVLQNTTNDPTVAVSQGNEVFVAGTFTGAFSTCSGTASKAYFAALGPFLGGFAGGPFCYSAGTADVASYGVAVDSGGNAVLSLGSTGGAIQSSGQGFATPVPAASVVAVKLASPYGDYQWAQPIAPTGAAYGGGVAVDGMGDVTVVANTNTSFTLGTQTVGGNGVVVVAGLAP